MFGRKLGPQSFVICFTLVLLAKTLPGQQSEVPRDFGTFQGRKAKIQKLLVLKNENSMLGLSRDWPVADATERQDQLQRQIEILQGRGFDARIAAKLAGRAVPGGFKSHPLGNLFSQLRGASGSMGRSIMNNRWKINFSDRELHGDLRVAQESITLVLREKNDPSREISIRDDGRGQFSLGYLGKNFELDIQQDRTGAIEIRRTVNGKLDQFSARNYSALQEEHLEFVKNWMIPTLEYSGFVMPLAKSDIVVKRAVVGKLVAMDQRDVRDFNALLSGLSDDNFQVREKSTNTLQQQIDQWLDLAKEAVLSDDLPSEAFHRLNSIISNSSKNNPVEELILAENLLNSPQYLIQLLELADPSESQAIIRQLQRLTGKTLSTPDEWKNVELSQQTTN